MSPANLLILYGPWPWGSSIAHTPSANRPASSYYCHLQTQPIYCSSQTKVYAINNTVEEYKKQPTANGSCCIFSFTISSHAAAVDVLSQPPWIARVTSIVNHWGRLFCGHRLMSNSSITVCKKVTWEIQQLTFRLRILTIKSDIQPGASEHHSFHAKRLFRPIPCKFFFSVWLTLAKQMFHVQHFAPAKSYDFPDGLLGSLLPYCPYRATKCLQSSTGQCATQMAIWMVTPKDKGNWQTAWFSTFPITSVR